MYCIKCGVRLADTETRCPLCGTWVYHPDLPRAQETPLYPAQKMPPRIRRSLAAAVALTAMILVAMLTVFLCDLQLGGGITWSGYVMGALLVAYVCLVLPLWFTRPNPVIFVPCGFAAAALYMLYIQLVLGGRWFWLFALPVTAGIGLLITAVVTLVYYLRRGRLYVFGGALIAFGLFMLPVELLAGAAFGARFFGWFVYPMIPLILLGGGLIFLAAYRPARETMERKFFI